MLNESSSAMRKAPEAEAWLRGVQDATTQAARHFFGQTRIRGVQLTSGEKTWL